MTTPWAIETDDLAVHFGDHRAVDGVDLRLAQGSVLGLLGPNGAGKTTTVRALATLLRPTSGSARIFGHDVAREADTVRTLIGLTGQYASVDEDLTARQNLTVFARLNGLGRSGARRRAEELLEEFTLTGAADRRVQTFSGGMRRRLDLAASLIGDPPLIFLDEPTTGLDPRTRVQMWETVRRLVAAGTTVLLTTQYLEEADQLADRIAVIDHGRVVAEGTADELKSQVAPAVVRLVPHEAARVDDLAAILRDRIGSSEASGAGVSAPMADPDLLAGVLVAAGEAGIGLAEVTMAKPSLDEVFFALTGHGQTQEAAP